MIRSASGPSPRPTRSGARPRTARRASRRARGSFSRSCSGEGSSAMTIATSSSAARKGAGMPGDRAVDEALEPTWRGTRGRAAPIGSRACASPSRPYPSRDDRHARAAGRSRGRDRPVGPRRARRAGTRPMPSRTGSSSSPTATSGCTSTTGAAPTPDPARPTGPGVLLLPGLPASRPGRGRPSPGGSRRPTRDRRRRPARPGAVGRADGGLRRRRRSRPTPSPWPRDPGARRTGRSSSPATGSGRSWRRGAGRAARPPVRRPRARRRRLGASWRRPTDLDVDEFLRGLDEPPEVLRSMGAWLGRPARVRTRPAGTRPGAGGEGRPWSRRPPGTSSAPYDPHVVEAMRADDVRYDPAPVLAAVEAPVTALIALEIGDDGARLAELRRCGEARVGGGTRADPARRLPGRRAQPDALPAGGGDGGDPREPGDRRLIARTRGPRRG